MNSSAGRENRLQKRNIVVIDGVYAEKFSPIMQDSV